MPTSRSDTTVDAQTASQEPPGQSTAEPDPEPTMTKRESVARPITLDLKLSPEALGKILAPAAPSFATPESVGARLLAVLGRKRRRE